MIDDPHRLQGYVIVGWRELARIPTAHAYRWVVEVHVKGAYLDDRE